MKSEIVCERVLFGKENGSTIRPFVPLGSSTVENQFRSLGIGVEVHQFDELENSDVAPMSTTIGFNLSDPVDVEFRRDGKWQTETFGSHDVGIFPADVPFSSRLRETNRGILLSIEDSLFNRLMPEGGTTDLLGLASPLVTKDVYLAESMRLIANHAKSVTRNSSLYADTIAASMAIHLVTRYGNSREHRNISYSFGRNQSFLPAVNAYITENIGKEIRLKDLADLVDLSPFHFSRLFKATTGTSPYRYVMDRRLDKGVEMLRTTRAPISQIALDVGFCDQSHFTRELSKALGITPRQVRRSF